MNLGNAYNIRTATNVLQRNPALVKPLIKLVLFVALAALSVFIWSFCVYALPENRLQHQCLKAGQLPLYEEGTCVNDYVHSWETQGSHDKRIERIKKDNQ